MTGSMKCISSRVLRSGDDVGFSCDGTACPAFIDLVHNLDYECDAGYAFNEALGRAGWADVYSKKWEKYVHLCSLCWSNRNLEGL